ncbi:MAG: hypothetical protein ACK5OX_03280 [Desertimonas sp.]
MTVTICWSVKGGTGTTVAVAALALHARTSTTLVDLDGDLPAVLGVDEPDGQGLTDWFAADVAAAAIGDLALEVTDRVRLIARGHGALPGDHHPRWERFGEWLAAVRSDVVIDAGTGELPGGLIAASPNGRRLLATRPCYLSLRRAARSATRPDGIILIAEPGRRLRPRDVETSVGAPIVATFSLDPAVARAVDSGLLTAGVPKPARREMRRAS